MSEPRFKRVKRAAPKGATSARVVWVSRRTRQAHLIKRLSAMLDKNEAVMVNGLGAAVLPAVDLCLELNRRWNNNLTLDVITDTVQLTDEMRPLEDGEDASVETRLNSAVRIAVKRKK